MPPILPPAIDYLNPRVWAGVVRYANYPTVHIGETYLPMREVGADKIFWEIFHQQARLAPFVSIDAESPRMARAASQVAWADIVYVREKVQYKESDISLLRLPGQPPVVDAAGSIGLMQQTQASRLAQDAADLKEHVNNTIEWMRINSLLGSLAVTPHSAENLESPISFTINYPVRTITPAALWSDTANSDPLQDFQNWTLNLPYQITEMIASPEALLYLARSAHLLRYFGAFGGAISGVLPTETTTATVKRWFSTEFGINVTEYRSVYSTYVDDGTTVTETLKRFLPSNKIILLPTPQVGYTATRRAPQSDPAWQSGVFSWAQDPAMSGRKDPWLYEHGVGFYGVPILEHPEQISVATIA